jgi:hypothetical protein
VKRWATVRCVLVCSCSVCASLSLLSCPLHRQQQQQPRLQRFSTMDHSMELTKEHEEYRLARPMGTGLPASLAEAGMMQRRGSFGANNVSGSAGGARASSGGPLRRGKKEEDVMCCHLYAPARTSLFVGTSSGTLLVWKPKNEFQSGLNNHLPWGPRCPSCDTIVDPHITLTDADRESLVAFSACARCFPCFLSPFFFFFLPAPRSCAASTARR